MTVNVTSGGRESGALPILERHWVEVENRDVCGRANAGTRNAGSVASARAVDGVESKRARDERMQCRVAIFNCNLRSNSHSLLLGINL